MKSGRTIDLKITEQEIRGLGDGIVAHISHSKGQYNLQGGEHTELRGRVVRQCDVETFTGIIRNVVLTEMDHFVFERAPAAKVGVSMRIWPELTLRGEGECFGDWYVRMSVYVPKPAKVA